MTLCLAQQPDADELLDRDPLALLLGMMLDQQIAMEKAFAGPYFLARRMGVERLDAAAIASADPGVFAKLFATPPAIHRFPAAMAERAQALASAVVANYGGDAASLWSTASSGKELADRLMALPGFGPQKAKIFVALLAKQRGVRPRGWREVAQPYSDDGVYHSVADVTDVDSLRKVREHKKAMKAARGAASAS